MQLYPGLTEGDGVEGGAAWFRLSALVAVGGVRQYVEFGDLVILIHTYLKAILSLHFGSPAINRIMLERRFIAHR